VFQVYPKLNQFNFDQLYKKVTSIRVASNRSNMKIYL
jgi:hypothetical protein